MAILFDAAFFLGGDSYPKGAVLEAAIERNCSPFFAEWSGQREISARCGFGESVGAVADRADGLRRLVAGDHRDRSVVLFGRSSGARVASLLGDCPNVAAVVCISYPFRHPKRAFEPERVAHLATVTTPTLIVQGRSDEYGGEGEIGAYRLSPHVQMMFVDGSHKLRMSKKGWSRIGKSIHEFLKEVRTAANENSIVLERYAS